MKNETTREYKGISDRARGLLAREEGLDVEFKQSIDALDITDIVAFANSAYGGAILVGIKEVHLQSGRQKAEIYGVPVGDHAKMQIVQKVNAIVPQLAVDIIVENAGSKPFYRIEIPSGEEKPYCTTAGIYKIRDDGYSKPLLPGTMLSLMLERESEKFYQRFTQATEMLEDEILNIRKRAIRELNEVERNLNEISIKTDAVLNSLGIDDPVAARQQEQIRKVAGILRSLGTLEEKDIIKLLGDIFPDADPKVISSSTD